MLDGAMLSAGRPFVGFDFSGRVGSAWSRRDPLGSQKSGFQARPFWRFRLSGSIFLEYIFMIYFRFRPKAKTSYRDAG